MITAEVMEQIWPIFADEAKASCEKLAEGILQLEAPVASRPAGLTAAIRRHAHTLKGSAGSIGLGDLERVCHAMETCLDGASETEELDRTLVDALAQAVTALRGSIVTASASRPPRIAEVETLTATLLARGSARCAPAPSTASPTVRDEPEPQEATAGGDDVLRVRRELLDGVAESVERAALLHGTSAARAEQAAALADALTRVREALAAAQGADVAALVTPALRRTQQLARALADDAERLGRITGTLRHGVRTLRMVPAREVLAELPLTLRDLAVRTGKRVRLVCEGEDVKVDRRVLEALRPALLHLVRNAVDHGIEDDETRTRGGKVPDGTLKIAVARKGARILVTVEDDGAGLDLARIRAHVVQRGWVPQSVAAAADDATVARWIFRAGLSTAGAVTALSGRGIGLDVVDATARQLGGSVDVAFEAGRWTRFTLDLPTTAAALLGVLVQLGDVRTVIPSEAIARVQTVPATAISKSAGRLVARVGDALLPLVPLRTLAGTTGSSAPSIRRGGQPVVILAQGGQRCAVTVDAILGVQELVLRPLSGGLGHVRILAGAAVLDDGRLVSVLNPQELLSRAAGMASADRPPVARRLLVADDSLSTRTLVKSILEIAGYDVVCAADGEEAWARLQDGPVDLVVSDVQMPRLDGLGLTRKLKADAGLAAIPVVLLTSLGAGEDRAAGLRAGADGYVVKQEIDRGRLLEVVRQFAPLA